MTTKLCVETYAVARVFAVANIDVEDPAVYIPDNFKVVPTNIGSMQRLIIFSSLALACVYARTDAKTSKSEPRPYSTWMLESIISRGEGIRAADGLLSGIQKGIFQEAVRAAVEWSTDEEQKKKWLEYHRESVKYNAAEFLDPIEDSLAPLDRLCAGRSLMFVRSAMECKVH